jgi:hypothetical protein
MRVESAMKHSNLREELQNLKGRVGAAAIDDDDFAGPSQARQGSLDVGCLIASE